MLVLSGNLVLNLVWVPRVVHFPVLKKNYRTLERIWETLKEGSKNRDTQSRDSGDLEEGYKSSKDKSARERQGNYSLTDLGMNLESQYY